MHAFKTVPSKRTLRFSSEMWCVGGGGGGGGGGGVGDV